MKLYTNESMAEHQIVKLANIVQNGIAPCYRDFQHFLCDFYPNFSWNRPGMHAQIKIVLADHRYPAIAKGIMDQYNFDMTAELNAALTYED